MSLLSPLAPYMLGIRIGIVVVSAVLLLGVGCNYGKRRQAAKDQARITQLDNDLVIAKAQTVILSGKLETISAETESAKKLAEEKAKQALSAEKRAEKAQADADKAIEQAGRAVEDAKRDPLCRKQLEVPVCAAIL